MRGERPHGTRRYRDAIRGEFRRQTSRGHNEDLITLEARYAPTKVPGSAWRDLLGSIRLDPSSRVDMPRDGGSNWGPRPSKQIARKNFKKFA